MQPSPSPSPSRQCPLAVDFCWSDMNHHKSKCGINIYRDFIDDAKGGRRRPANDAHAIPTLRIWHA